MRQFQEEQLLRRKECKQCGENLSLSDFYSRNQVNKEGEVYIYYHPKCKKCDSKNAVRWQKDNPERQREIFKKYDATRPEHHRKQSERRRALGELRDWQRINKDKIRKYNLKREIKNHKISSKEWINCKKYFNNSCAYCELNELEHKKIYNQQLHKEHVDHDGANDLSNCVPGCKSCNSSKRIRTLSDWYNENNPKFTQERLDKIQKWLEEDYLLFLDFNRG